MAVHTVAYQGIPGSYSYLTAHATFGDSATFLGKNSFKVIFESLVSGEASHAVVPVENSLIGSIHEICDLISSSEVFIEGESYYRVAHNLLGIKQPGVTPNEQIARLKQVLSHPKALEQCQRFFEQHPTIEQVAFSDTAGAAQEVAKRGDPQIAAIASYQSAELYGVGILQENLEDDPDNYTRFVTLTSTEHVPSPLCNKCSLHFSLPHVPASLFHGLEIFALRGINVTKIESRPIHGQPFEYNFNLDLTFAPYEISSVYEALEEFKLKTKTFKLLGFYEGAALT